MKDSYPQISLARFCRLFGITRQAFYQHFWSLSDVSIEQDLVLQQAKEIRKVHPVIGTRKLYCLLQPFLVEHQIKIGRDALFDLLSANKMLVRKRKRRISTTQSHHWLKKHPNLTKEWWPQKPGQLWVADITYVPMKNGFLYLSLITDAYSHKIMGYYIADTLEAVHTVKALQMALQSNAVEPHQLIHHSDRGIQYCSTEYVELLNKHGIKISMTQSGDPLENPVAERINGIIKDEYLKHHVITNQLEAMKLLEQIVGIYNCKRPHQSINMLTPEIVHQQRLLVNKQWGKQRFI
jgi:transposase InsO family protein